MRRAVGATAAAGPLPAAAAPPAHPLAGSLTGNSAQSEASADVEELYGPLPPFTAPKVARTQSETAAPPLPDRQPGQPPPPPEEAGQPPPKQQHAPPAAAPPKPAPKPQPQAAKQPPPRWQPPPKPPPPRQQPQPPKQQATSGSAKAGTNGPPPAANCKYRPGEHTFPYQELKGLSVESGIDMARKEDYLSPEEFRQVFGMEHAAFKAMKRWRQLEEKKRVGLF